MRRARNANVDERENGSGMRKGGSLRAAAAPNMFERFSVHDVSMLIDLPAINQLADNCRRVA